MEINIKSNKFDNDIIKRQSYKIIQDDSIQRNANSNMKQFSYNIPNNNDYDENNYDNDEDKNINLNININNYLSKKNININSNAPINNFHYTLNKQQNIKKLKKYNTDLTKGYLVQHTNKNLQKNNTNKYQYNNKYNYNNIRETKEELKSKILSRINKQKIGLNNLDLKRINITTKKPITESNNNINEKPKEKEQIKHIPKILTFLQTFKNISLPLKKDKKKRKEFKNKLEDKNQNNEKNKNNIIGVNNSCYNFNYKPKKIIEINKNIIENKRHEENMDINDEECIDYNRFTFRNSGDEGNSFSRKNNKRDTKKRKKNRDREEIPIYNEESSDSDINKNINIDAYKRKCKNNNKIMRKQNKNIEINNYIRNKNIENSQEFSPDFKRKKQIKLDLNIKRINNTNKPYFRKNILNDQYSSPRPLPKNEIKKINSFTNNNIYQKKISTYQNDYLESGNESENSFRSINPSKIYRKQILNNSFQINVNTNRINNNSFYYNNDISSDQINSEKNYYTINRPNKKKKINEILINLNDSEESSNNEQNFNPRKNLRIGRSPINRKDNNNNILMNRSPYSSKQIKNKNISYEYSENYESQPEEENINKAKKNTNYLRFMKPFENKDKNRWYNEDSYLSYDLKNINKNDLNKKPFKKDYYPVHNKNNSMYIKQIVHYENKRNSFFNESNNSFSDKKNKNEFSDYDDINNNVYDFDAPKSINDFMDDKFSSNSSISMNESSRENKFSVNCGLQSNRKQKDDIHNNNQTLSFREEDKPKIVYQKKLNTMYNFYQGTKKWLSNINNKVFGFIKKDNKINEKNNINNNNIKRDSFMNNRGNMTPRIEVQNEKDNLIYMQDSSFTPMGFENRQIIYNYNVRIKEKIRFKKNCFYKKFYNYYIKAIEKNNLGAYFSYQKINKIKPKKKKINIPNSFLRYFKKEKIKIIKIPLIKECFFDKAYIIKKNQRNIDEIKYLKKKVLKCDNQINIIFSKKLESKENEVQNKNDFSFSNNNNLEFQNIKPENIWNVSFINTKKIQNPNNKKYVYEYIISLKNKKISLQDDLLPTNVKDHFRELNEVNDMININSFEENDLQKKYKKSEIQKIINRYTKPNKNQKFNLNENKDNKTEINKDNDKWARSDFTKETQQAEKYVKELNKKMEENNIQNNIIGILNILTMDNLNEVIKKIMTLITRNEDNFILSDEEIIKNEKILIKNIFNKAIIETRFVNLYAKLSHELFHKLNNVCYNSENFKTIMINECKNKFNELIKNEKILKNKVISLDDENIVFIKKSFIGNIDFISELINSNLFDEDIGFNYLEELNKIYNDVESSEQIDKFKKNIALEATVNFLSKFGKKIFSDKNINYINKLNTFINSNLKSIMDNKDLSGFLKYKIINLIEKQKNKWQDSLFEKSILAKGKSNNSKDNKKKKGRKRRHSNKSLKMMNQNNTLNTKPIKDNNYTHKSLNSSTITYYSHINLKLNTSNSTSYMEEDIIKLIEQDIIKYQTFFNEKNIKNKIDLDKNIQIGNEFDWSTIEEILSTNKINLSEIIRCYVEVCIDEIIDSNKIFITNDYIKNIICYYSSDLTNKEKDIIHNKIVKLFLNIRDICIDNNNMKLIMGYLMLILIENKLYHIKDLNNFIGLDTEIIITIAEIVKNAIIFSGEKCKKYHNDFKQTKLFIEGSIFIENVTNKISDILK